MNRYTFVLIYLLISNPFIYSQNSDTTYYSGDYSFIVDSIYVSGNDKTEEEIILKELTFRIGDTITPKIIKFNKERIFSLRIFTNVDLIPFKKNNKNFITIIVKESWYLYPVPFFRIKENDWDKLSYGLALLVFNFRGRNETIIFSGALGFDPSLRLSYRIPYIDYNNDISLSTSLGVQKVKNKSNTAKNLFGGDFDQNVYSVEITLGRRLNTFNNIEFTTGFASIESPTFIKGVSASDSRIDNLFSLAFNYTFDNRNLKQFPSEGFFASSLFQLNGLGIDGIAYQVLNFDIRNYLKLNDDLILKGRISSRYTFGDLVPYYDNSFLGFGERIRGHFRQELEGRNSYIGSLELDYPILKDINIDLDFIPIIPKSLLKYRFAIYLQLFSDTGLVQNKNEPLALKKLNTGYGVGLTFLFLPYNVLRLERAWDEFGNPEWIFNVGVSF